MKMFLPVVCCLFVVAVGCEGTQKPGSPGSPSDRAAKADASPNNTAVNDRDRGNDTLTPIDQSEGKRDIEMTANIRKHVVKADLSTDANNVKIITQDGHVTLRGPVDSEAEKTQVGKIAVEIAGPKNVDNQLEVAVDR